MGVEAECARHLLQPEAMRQSQHSETETWKPSNRAQDWQRSANPPPLSLGLSHTAHGVSGPPDLLRQLANPRARQAVVLQMQRSHGNR